MTELASIIARLPAESRYISTQNSIQYSSTYYDTKLVCNFNKSIQITYRCDLSTKQWIYVYGHSKSFQKCYPPCGDDERKQLLNKYFTEYEQTKIRTRYVPERNSLRVSCLNRNERRWKSIRYKCDSMIITPKQWYHLHSCFHPFTVLTTTLPSKFDGDLFS